MAAFMGMRIWTLDNLCREQFFFLSERSSTDLQPPLETEQNPATGLLLVRISLVLLVQIGHTGRKYYMHHVLVGLVHSWPKEAFTCHTSVRFSTKVSGMDLAKDVLLHRLKYHNCCAFVNNATFHWQFVPIIPAGAQRLWDVCSVCWPLVDNDFV